MWKRVLTLRVCAWLGHAHRVSAIAVIWLVGNSPRDSATTAPHMTADVTDLVPFVRSARNRIAHKIIQLR